MPRAARGWISALLSCQRILHPFIMQDRIRERLIDTLLGKPIVTNTVRGLLVEAIVAEVLEPDWQWVGGDWGACDFRHDGGIGLELKQSAARQSWHAADGPASSPRYDVAERSGRWEGPDWIPGRGRMAEIYVFAHHPIVDAALADHREPGQWQFYVVPAANLPLQKTVGLVRVTSMAPCVGIDRLEEAVEAVRRALAG